MLITKREKYGTWAELKKQALKYEKQGFICEVKGWADISMNVLTVSVEGEDEHSEKMRQMSQLL